MTQMDPGMACRFDPHLLAASGAEFRQLDTGVAAGAVAGDLRVAGGLPSTDAWGRVMVYGYSCAECLQVHWSVPHLELDGTCAGVDACKREVGAILEAQGLEVADGRPPATPAAGGAGRAGPDVGPAVDGAAADLDGPPSLASFLRPRTIVEPRIDPTR